MSTDFRAMFDEHADELCSGDGTERVMTFEAFEAAVSAALAAEPVDVRQPGQAPQLRAELRTVIMQFYSREAIANAIVDGTLHDAIKIDWSAIQ